MTARLEKLKQMKEYCKTPFDLRNDWRDNKFIEKDVPELIDLVEKMREALDSLNKAVQTSGLNVWTAGKSLDADKALAAFDKFNQGGE